ncbi:hypothetical protein [Variovorax sp. PAMC26660]|uniref:hypothetical protein n=1 Tax=Variovorax sp. PAMC26660 TaxID=2762322 RepID=UPI00164D128E|nr:hypothetical protein [Variovorax sp. PAMC26660]QNK65777.1 hypothetical protein H7F35_21480 [Variovorax sp. PAMC26660]
MSPAFGLGIFSFGRYPSGMSNAHLVRYVTRVAGIVSLFILLAKLGVMLGLSPYEPTTTNQIAAVFGLAIWLQAEWAWRKQSSGSPKP